MPIFKRCCCCCQLRTGVTVVGWIGLVAGIIKIAVISLALSKHEDRLFSIINKAVGGNLDIDAWLVLQMCFALVGLLTFIGLLWGSFHGNRFFLVPWLFMGMIELIIYFILFIALVIVAFTEDPGLGVSTLVLGIIFLGYMLYIWLCVLSCFQELREGTVIIPQIPVQSISVTHQNYPPAFTVPVPLHAPDMSQVVK